MTKRAKTYIGRPCKLGHTERYVSNSDCVACARKVSASWRKSNSGKVKEYNQQYRDLHGEGLLRRRREQWDPAKGWAIALRKYGLTVEEWHALLVKQLGRCAICNLPMFEPHVDHDHKTGRVRGLLCDHCNLGLGHFRDSQELLGLASKYLEG